MPSPSRDLLKSDFGDGQAEGLVPVLSNSMLVRVLWNHNLVLDRKRRSNPSLGQSTRPKTTPDPIGPAFERPLQCQAEILLQRDGVGDATLNDLSWSRSKHLPHIPQPLFRKDLPHFVGCVLQEQMKISEMHCGRFVSMQAHVVGQRHPGAMGPTDTVVAKDMRR